MNDLHTLFADITFPCMFTAEEQELLCTLDMGVKSVAAGETLIQEGARDRDLWLLLAGHYQVIKKVQPGFPLGFLQAGSFCGEIAWFTGEQRTASVVAMEAGLALRICYKKNHLYGEELLLKIYHNTLTEVMGRLDAMNKLLFQLAELEKQHFGGSLLASPVGFFKGIPFFDYFTEDEVNLIRGMTPGFDRVRRGEYIFKEGDDDNTFFVLLQGNVMITLNADPRLILVTLGPERVLGMDTLFRAGPKRANVIALERCEGLRISLDCFQTLDPAFKLKLYWQMALNFIDRLTPMNIAKIKLEHMQGKMWFGG
ncbi:MAG: cyclic nucleotide-binding domain-containing protein [Magnetococcus sp. YQC-5]